MGTKAGGLTRTSRAVLGATRGLAGNNTTTATGTEGHRPKRPQETTRTVETTGGTEDTSRRRRTTKSRKKGRVVAPQGRVQKIPESSRERAGTRNGPHHAGQYPGEAPNHNMNHPNESMHTWTTRGSGRIHTEASEGPYTTQGRALQAPAEAGQGTDDGPQVEPQPRLRKGRQWNEAPTSQHRPGQEDWIYMHQTPRHQV